MRNPLPIQGSLSRQNLLYRTVDVVSDIKIEIAIPVRIKEGRAHAPAVIGDICLCGDICKTPVAVVAIQAVWSEVGDIQIQPAILVIICYADANPPQVIADASLLRNIFKSAIPFVPIQDIFSANGRGTISDLPPVDEIQIYVPIVIVVEKRRATAD